MEKRKTLSAIKLQFMFGTLAHAKVSVTQVRAVYNVKVDFEKFKLNSEEKQTVSKIAKRSDGFEHVTAKDVRTLAAISRMAEFRAEDRESLR